MLMFSEELSCYTNVVVSSLILKMRSEDAPLENDVFHSVTWQHLHPLMYPQNISVQVSLFFNGLWPFAIKITSAFKRSF